MDNIWFKWLTVCVCGLVVSTDLSAGQRCQDCLHNGILFKSNQAFEYRADCLEMTGCFCYCNGQARCEKERNICDRTISSARDFHSNTRTRYQSFSSNSGSSSSSGSGSGAGQVIKDVRDTGCRKCYVGGGEIDGGTYFNHKNGCISYSSCYCGCDGNWQCPAQNAKNTCTGSGSGVIIGRDESSCRSCVIEGVPYVGNSDFTYRNNCLEWTDCRCRCDGSWRCSSSSAKWICDNVCRECEVEGRKYPGKSQFRYAKDCTVYDPCICNCDGSWNCPAENGKWICTDKCLECTVNGRKYAGNSEFSLREDCWEWNPCTCNCDGSWECPRDNAKWVCTDQCLQCDVNGKKYEGNTLFQYVDGCYEYNCNCRCDGGWSCPANRTRDICRLNMATGCYYCNVNGKKFEGNSLFSYEDGCIKYDKCTCNCDGSWECPGERATYTCRRNVTTGCNYCDVYGQQMRGNSRFEMQQDCWRYDCECDCNGYWRCYETGAQYICGSQLLDTTGCKSCLAEGQRFPGQSSFEISWGCVTHQCTCNCDGSWYCPSRLAKNTCSNSHFQNFLIKTITNLPNSWCSECTIGGSVYPGYSQLEYQEQCTRQYARCYCNGGYRFDSSIITGCTESTHISVAKGNCIQCTFNDKNYTANSVFEISSQCKRYRCKCECNGLAACQPISENVCGTVLTTIRSSQFETNGEGGTVVVGGGGTIVERGRVVVTGGETGTSGGTLVVSGTGGTSETVATGTSGQRTVVIGGGTQGQTSGSRTVIASGSSGIEQTSGSRTVVVDGTRTTGSRTIVVGGSGDSTPSKETSVVVTGGGGSSTGRTVVQIGGVESSSSEGTIVTTGDGSACYHCVGLDGKKYPGNSEFTFRRGCAVWRCQCNCYGRALCRPHDLSACLVEPQCRDCVVEGRTYPSNRMFSYEKDCVVHQCRCMCDGQPRCVQTVAVECEERKAQCKQCVVQGKSYLPNTMFDLESRCRKQRCQCDCSGEYRCSRAVNTCVGEEIVVEDCQPCDVDGKEFAAGTTFQVDRGCYRMTCSCSCKDRLTCDQSATINICDTRPRTQCKACEVDGERYAPNSKFEREEGCIRKQCQCNCNGDYQCSSTGVNICGNDTTVTSTQTGVTSTIGTSITTEKKDCEVCLADRIERKIGVPFCLDRGCKRYTCECYCNGRYACQTDKPENICDDSGNVIARSCDTAAISKGSTVTEETERRQTGSKTTSGGERSTSTTTHLTETRSTTISESGASIFDYEERQGGVVVPAAVRGERCMPCNIQEQFYDGNSEFFLQLECKQFRCRCNCDGTWECPRQRPRNTCRTEESCRPCSLRGKTYPANSNFTVDIDQCRKYQCACPCDGRYSCPPQNIINICTGERQPTQCSDCTVNSRRYPGNAEFSYDEGCNRFNCICKCDGSWDCPAEKTVNTCTSPSTGCRECEVKGQRYRGNSQFAFDDGCNRFNCICKCDGSWDCPAEKTVNTCTSPSTGCRECEVKGQRYRGNSQFAFDDGCNRFNCICKCDGSWDCPAEKTVNTCTSPSTGCRECEVKGQRYRGNSQFAFDDGCNRFNCICKCDGSWDCPAEKTVNTCTSPSTGCRECEVKGQRYRGNSQFAFDDGCNRFNCICKCDGSWDCPAEKTVNTCTSPSTGCRECEVKGQRYRGNSQFAFDEDCNRFNCICKCDGSWDCPAEKTVNTCTSPSTGCRECEVKGQRYRGNSRFKYDDGCSRYNCDCSCDGSYNCPASRTENICANETSQCTNCEVKGRRYRGNSRFSYDESCSRYNCDCNCDGSWNCPSSRTERICNTDATQKCRECVVDGRRYPGNAPFLFDRSCNRFSCECRCDGSFDCPPARTQRICDSAGNRLRQYVELDYKESDVEQGRRRTDSRETIVSGSQSSSGHNSSSTGSHRTGSGSSYESKTVSETLTSIGSESVSSSSSVGGSQTITELRTRSGTTSGSRVDSRGCRACVVKGVEHRSHSVFEFDDNCFRFNCDCRCDGSWSCPASRTVNICQEKCTDCSVRGRKYPPNTIFEYEEGCVRFNCDCSCDGSFNCPAERSKDICSGRPDKCRNCEVESQEYPPNRRFQYEKGCIRYDCDCNCDGSYRCPSERSTDICRGVESRTCRECKVNGKTYPPNKEFSYIDSCDLKKCMCSCDGTHQCPSTTNICGSQICRDCLVKGNRYLAKSSFQFTERCEKFNCDCLCDGSWTCPAERTENLCTSGHCGSCSVRNTKYQGNSVFVLTENCRQFQCVCHCDGRWECSDESVNVCNAG